jgi:hypothetical protein
MLPEFGQIVRRRREQLGLRHVDVVRMLGRYKPSSFAKPIRLLERLERHGGCSAEFFRNVIAALQLDEALIATIAQQHEDAYQRTLDEPVQPTICWIEAGNGNPRHRPHGVEFLPWFTPVRDAIEQATQYAREHSAQVRLTLSRRQAVLIDCDGNVQRVDFLDRRLTEGVQLVLNGQRFWFDRETK